jgi:prepilin-type N-terminal cleavage/methylation domain-containing protein
MKHRGFTLTEVLIVMAIIVVLAGISIPLGRSILGKSRQAACLNNLRSLGVGLESYLQDHQQKLPELAAGRASKADDSPVLETVLLPYIETPEAFKCPQDSKQYHKSGSSYLWNSTQSGLHVSQLSFFGIKDRPDKIPLITDKEAWHPSGTNFLYADQTSSNRIRFATAN